MLIKFLLHGKEINLTGDNVIIKSNNFNVDKNGNMNCNNANITGGNLNIESTLSNPTVKITGNNYFSNLKTQLYGLGIISNVSDGSDALPLSRLGISSYNNALIGELTLRENIGGSQTDITPYGVVTPTLTQTSLEENKKNFEKLENGLSIINNTEIYKYNLKNEKDEDKKHIGFVIGDNFKYSKKITSLNNDGVDTYSMVSVAYKAIQEQQEQIEQLQKEIKELKGEK